MLLFPLALAPIFGYMDGIFLHDHQVEPEVEQMRHVTLRDGYVRIVKSGKVTIHALPLTDDELKYVQAWKARIEGTLALAKNLKSQAQSQLDHDQLTEAERSVGLSRKLFHRVSDGYLYDDDPEAELIQGRIYLCQDRYAEALKVLQRQEEALSDGRLFAEIALCRLKLGDIAGAEVSFHGKNGMDSPQGFEATDFPGTADAKGLECRILLKLGKAYSKYGTLPEARRRLGQALALAPGNEKVASFVHSLLDEDPSEPLSHFRMPRAGHGSRGRGEGLPLLRTHNPPQCSPFFSDSPPSCPTSMAWPCTMEKSRPSRSPKARRPLPTPPLSPDARKRRLSPSA